MRKFQDGRDWFSEARFGLFVHWGLYALNGWHEQEQFRKGLPRKDYTPLAGKFNPTGFKPDAWLDAAEEAGMRYLCFTAKHIDGFCLWNTAQTPYNIMNTPYGKDVFGMLAEACHRRNFPLCVYYAVPDMNCAHYPNQGRSYELPAPEPGDEPDVAKYVDFVKAQVAELCSNYGKIHGFWWDANAATLKHHDASVNRLVRALQPGIIINNRGFDEGDFSTPERDFDEPAATGTLAYDKPTEACESIGAESWGHRHNEDYFSVGALTRSIAKHMGKGGNYLLNVGPEADGTFPPEALRILAGVGKWHHAVKEAFEGAEPCAWLDGGKLLACRKGDVLYVHLLTAPQKSGLILKPIAVCPRSAVVLNNGQELKAELALMPSLHQDKSKCLHLWNLPVDELANEAVVLKLEFEPSSLNALT